MPRKGIRANLRRATVAPVACVAVYPILEQDVAQFVGKRTALPHGVPGARDTDEYSSAGWIPHCQAMLVWAHVKHGHVDPSCLFDDLQKVTQRLNSEMMILTEPCSELAALRLRSQCPAPRLQARGRLSDDIHGYRQKLRTLHGLGPSTAPVCEAADPMTADRFGEGVEFPGVAGFRGEVAVCRDGAPDLDEDAFVTSERGKAGEGEVARDIVEVRHSEALTAHGPGHRTWLASAPSGAAALGPAAWAEPRRLRRGEGDKERRARHMSHVQPLVLGGLFMLMGGPTLIIGLVDLLRQA
jgi:hypothetical protein